MVKGAHSSNKLVRIGALLDAVVSVGIGIIRALARVLEMTPSSISSALLQGCLCARPPTRLAHKTSGVCARNTCSFCCILS
jgi:predicted benzoate:H+ symporter BenE